MQAIIAAIVKDDAKAAKSLLRADGGLATWSIRRPKLYQSGIFHWIYVGDTLLHLAAAGYRVEIVQFAAALSAQRQIIQTFLSVGLSPHLKCGRGRTVMECARSEWIRHLLAGD